MLHRVAQPSLVICERLVLGPGSGSLFRERAAMKAPVLYRIAGFCSLWLRHPGSDISPRHWRAGVAPVCVSAGRGSDQFVFLLRSGVPFFDGHRYLHRPGRLVINAHADGPGLGKMNQRSRPFGHISHALLVTNQVLDRGGPSSKSRPIRSAW